MEEYKPFAPVAEMPQVSMTTYTPLPVYSQQSQNCWYQEDYHDGYPNSCNPHWHPAGRCCEHGCRLCYCKPWHPVPVGDGILILIALAMVYILFKKFKLCPKTK